MPANIGSGLTRRSQCDDVSVPHRWATDRRHTTGLRDRGTRANHGGQLEHAEKTLREIARAGADAIKLQTYTADSLTLDSDAAPFRIATGSRWDGRTLHDLYTEAALPWEWIPRLKAVADELGFYAVLFGL